MLPRIRNRHYSPQMQTYAKPARYKVFHAKPVVDLKTSFRKGHQSPGGRFQDSPLSMCKHFARLNFFTKRWPDLLYADATMLDPYEPVGCFRDQRKGRALPTQIKMDHKVDWQDMVNSFAAIIHACAVKVYENGSWYFGVEYYRECWSGVNSSMTYNRHGRSDNCFWNYSVGREWSIFVYRFVEG